MRLMYNLVILGCLFTGLLFAFNIIVVSLYYHFYL
jgi:hypothetical protein